MAYHKGDKVKWNWGGSTASGKVEKVYREEVSRKIKGNEVKRKATDDNPAYYIIQEDGDAVLKSHSELSKA